METNCSLNEQVLALHGNRVNSETKEAQACLLEILKVIDHVCREHGLTYYLLCGSMLGAVRHGGFIPWDDDADVGMPRKDYETLLAHANEWLPEGYELVSGERNPRYPYFFARIQDARTTYILRRQFDFVGGLPIDVYPIDGMTVGSWQRKWHYLRLSIAKKLLYFCLVDPYKHGHGLRSFFPRVVRTLFSPASLHHRIQRILREYSNDEAMFLADHDYKPCKGVMPKAVYGKPQRVKFEDTELNGVAQPDVYLRRLYGNYMELPKQLPPQNYRFLDLNKPWRQYIKEQDS